MQNVSSSDLNQTMWSDAEHYDRVAETRWGRYLTHAEKQAILSAHRASSAPSTVLDVGGGGGRWSQLLCQLGWRAICSEVNERSLAVCQERLPSATCILVNQSDEVLPVDDQSVSMVLCMEVFAVMPTLWFMEEAARVIRPEGLLVGVFNNKCSFRGQLKHAMHRVRGSTGFDYYNTCYKPWKAAMRLRGFEFIYEDGMCWLPFSRGSDSRLIKPLVALERKLYLHRVPDLSPWIVFVARKGKTVRP
jgi:ubiquinone/menaquinone biosynthesis C-methylase UbiE